jgi:hypothetical protein
MAQNARISGVRRQEPLTYRVTKRTAPMESDHADRTGSEVIAASNRYCGSDSVAGQHQPDVPRQHHRRQQPFTPLDKFALRRWASAKSDWPCQCPVEVRAAHLKE